MPLCKEWNKQINYPPLQEYRIVIRPVDLDCRITLQCLPEQFLCPLFTPDNIIEEIIMQAGDRSKNTFHPGWHSVDNSKNPYPLRNRLIANEATARADKPWRCTPSGSLGPSGCWFGNYTISLWVWVHVFISWPMGIRSLGVGKSRNSQHPISPMILTLVMI